MSNRDFRADLEREILRSDRNDLPLTLIIMDVLERSTRRHQGMREREWLISALEARARNTDALGWYRDQRGLRIGLILFNTNPEQARCMIESIREGFRETAPSLNGNGKSHYEVSFELYAHPGELAGRPAAPPAPRDADDHNGDGSRPNGEARDQRENPRAGDEPQVTAPPAAARELDSAEKLIARPLPFWKRSLDLGAASMGLALLSPLFLGIALLIKLTSRGPVFYKQMRVGRSGRLFEFWKFRTMRANYDTSAHKEHLRKLISQSADQSNAQSDDPMKKLDAHNSDITSIGRLLRIASLDELPQLINVLAGNMSLVGPRPCLPYEAEDYQRWCRRRFDTTPGITGLWQVMGKNKTSFNQMIRLDIFYIRRRSPWLDLKIMFLTIPTILKDIRDGLSRNKEREV